jgi:hypothetical protein
MGHGSWPPSDGDAKRGNVEPLIPMFKDQDQRLCHRTGSDCSERQLLRPMDHESM